MAIPRRTLLGLAVWLLLVSSVSRWWVGHQERQLGEQVAALAQPGDIRMLSSETCAICVQARSWFTEHRVAFSECLIERHEACRQAYEAQQAPGTPVIVVRGRAQLGFSPQRLQAALEDKA